MYRSAITKDRLLIEAVLPGKFKTDSHAPYPAGGSISHVFRNEESRSLVLQGKMDRVKWTIKTEAQVPQETTDEVLEIRIPLGYDFVEMGIVEKFDKGRVLLSFPAG